jgi:hypothetical protein
MGVVIEGWRPLPQPRNTLLGHLRTRFDSGFILDEVAIHLSSDDGRASPSTRPMVGGDGVALRDRKTGKVRYAGLIALATANIRRNWENQIIEALRAKHPNALPPWP